MRLDQGSVNLSAGKADLQNHNRETYFSFLMKGNVSVQILTLSVRIRMVSPRQATMGQVLGRKLLFAPQRQGRPGHRVCPDGQGAGWAYSYTWGSLGSEGHRGSKGLPGAQKTGNFSVRISTFTGISHLLSFL